MDGQDRAPAAPAAEGLAAAAWEARKLMRAARQAALSTLGGQYPFASLVTPAIAPDGAVLMLLSSLSDHSRHLAAIPACSLLFVGHATSANPQTAPRVTVSGVAARCVDAALKAHWLARHPYAAPYAGFTDFALWRLVPQAGVYIGGFGAAVRLPPVALIPDPAVVASLAAAGPRIVAACNASHAKALDRLASGHDGGGAWTMLGLDCDGFDMVQDQSALRIEFTKPVHDAQSAYALLTEMLAGAVGDERSG